MPTVNYERDERTKRFIRLCNRYRNVAKREYAIAYKRWATGQSGEQPDARDYRLPYMAAQAIRMEIHKIYDGCLHNA